jgi:predicted methyltransferase
MIRLTESAHAEVRSVLRAGEVAIDATAGNGHDTRFLADCVGPTGRVFAFDIQPAALERTAEVVGRSADVALLGVDHASMRETIPAEFRGRIGAVMFNLGYRPGGDKRVTTRTESTLTAIVVALELLRPGGVLTIVAYTGHPGGSDEAEAVGKLLAGLRPKAFAVREIRGESDSPGSPRLLVVHKAPDLR